MLLGVVLVGVAVGGLVATIGQPSAYSVPGFSKLVWHDLEAAYNIFATGKMHFPEFSLRFGILINRDAATSYYLSLYFWLALMMFEERISLERSTLIGVGITGMAILYALSWIYHRYFSCSHD